MSTTRYTTLLTRSTFEVIQMEIYIVSVVSVLLGYTSSRLANQHTKGWLPNAGVLSTLILGAVMLTFVGHQLTQLVTPSPKWLEGQWVERYTDNGKFLYAISTFKYNSRTKNLEFSGKAYDEEHGFVGEWSSVESRVDGDQYDYLFKGESYNPDPARQGLREGVGSIFFDSENHGRGIYLSLRRDREPRDIELNRILDEDAAKESAENPGAFVQKLYSSPEYFSEIIRDDEISKGNPEVSRDSQG